MKILTITAIIALPLMALGQTTEPQQTQEQTKDTQTTAPAKAKRCALRRRSRANHRQNLRRAQMCVDRRTFRGALRT